VTTRHQPTDYDIEHREIGVHVEPAPTLFLSIGIWVIVILTLMGFKIGKHATPKEIEEHE
jgi:hypothetical protein